MQDVFLSFLPSAKPLSLLLCSVRAVTRLEDQEIQVSRGRRASRLQLLPLQSAQTQQSRGSYLARCYLGTLVHSSQSTSL